MILYCLWIYLLVVFLLSPILSAGDVDGVFASNAGNASVTGTLSSLFASNSPLSTVLSCFLSLIANDSLLSAVSGCFFSLVIGGRPLSAISSHFSTLVASGCPFFIVFGCFLSFFAGSSPLSTIFYSVSLSPMPFAGFWVLFLTSTPSYTCCFSLPLLSFFYSSLLFLPILLTHNLTLLTEKRLFN